MTWPFSLSVVRRVRTIAAAAVLAGGASAAPPHGSADDVSGLVRVPPSFDAVLGAFLASVADRAADQPDVAGALAAARGQRDAATLAPSWDADVRLRSSVPLVPGAFGVTSTPAVPALEVSASATWSPLDPHRGLSIEDAGSRLTRVEVDGALHVRSSMLEAAWAAWTAYDLERRLAWISAAHEASHPIPAALAPWVDDVRAWATSTRFEVDTIASFLSHAAAVPADATSRGWGRLGAPWHRADWSSFLENAPSSPCIEGDDDLVRARADLAWAVQRAAAQSRARRTASVEVGLHLSGSASVGTEPTARDVGLGGWLRVRPPLSWGVRSGVRVEGAAHGLDVELSWSPGRPTAGTIGDVDPWDRASAEAALESAAFHARERAARDLFAVDRAGPLAFQEVALPDVHSVDAWSQLRASWPLFAVHAQAVEARLRWAFTCASSPSTASIAR